MGACAQLETFDHYWNFMTDNSAAILTGLMTVLVCIVGSQRVLAQLDSTVLNLKLNVKSA